MTRGGEEIKGRATIYTPVLKPQRLLDSIASTISISQSRFDPTILSTSKNPMIHSSILLLTSILESGEVDVILIYMTKKNKP